ncbi:MAG: bifunctional adenosylcobinamide kinase/adenosylcobinamide-phosphate guanylyltransferase [Lachnospiraceae bacterium]|nr:bifunctional adenosylcobinamide kinase/adenosylcobinamide-phosphate guanylyltransferase [Lachnospiraceae bacterium]
MMTLIIGGSGSGKSEYAERYITALSENCRKYYVATMQVSDIEAGKKVKRHQNMRKNKGFWTIEQPVSIDEALNQMEKSSSQNAALLECISNLTANEMFSGEKLKDGDEVAKKIIQDVKRLSEGLKHLVIVTNNVFEDGMSYDETTMDYIRAMGNINRKLAAIADKVVEVVVGIPVIVKEGK